LSNFLDDKEEAKRKSFAENFWLCTLHTSKNEIRKSKNPLIKFSIFSLLFQDGALEEYWGKNPEVRYQNCLNNHTGRGSKKYLTKSF